MKLIERSLGLEIELKENVISIIVVEDITLRLPIIEELNYEMSGNDGNWLLVENEKKYEIAKKVEIILEPFSLELNNKKIKTRLYQDIKSVSQDYGFAQGIEVHSHICSYIEQLIEKIPYPIKYKDEWDLLEILKAYEVEIEEECCDVCDKLFSYIKLVNHVCGINIFIIINIKQYLTENQTLELYKLAMYNKLQLILIEFNMQNNKIDNEEVYVIDKDGCIISY